MTHHTTLRRAAVRVAAVDASRLGRPRRTHSLQLLLVGMLAATPLAAAAQVNEALTATRVDDFILLQRGANGSLRAATVLDPGLALSHPLVDDALYSVAGGKGANILLDYLNPLRFSWSVDHKAQPEPLAVAVEKFLGSTDQLLAIINGASAAAGGAPAAPPAAAQVALTPAAPPAAQPAGALATRPPVAGAAATVVTYHDIALNEWALWMESRSACMGRQQGARAQLKLLAPKLDTLLHGTARTNPSAPITTAADFRAELLAATKALYAAASMSELRQALTASGAGAERLARANANLREMITALRTAAGGVKDSLEATPDCANLTAYTRGVVAGVAERAERVATTREALAKQFGEMHAAINEQVQKSASHHDVFLIGHATPTSKERIHVTVTISERAITTHEDRLEVKSLGSVTGTFQVMEHQSLVTELSVGIAYSAVAYPKFRTNQVGEQHLVADAGVDRPRMVAATMLNLIPNTGWSGFTRLVGQVGIGATTESPLVLLGGGLRLSHDRNLTLSFGAAFPFQKRLKSLKVGQPVAGDAELEQDIERALAKRPAFYLGIQR